MKKLYCAVLALLLLSMSATAQTTVFTDNFDRATFTTATSYGTPATLYKFTLGSTSTINTTLVSGGNYRANINSGTAASRALFYAPLSPYGSPFSRQISLNPGVVTWTFNMRTNTAVTSTTPATTAITGGIDLCSNAAGNIYNGLPTGYGVVFNSSATGGVALIRFSAGMAANTVLIRQTTTVPKTDFYSVRVTYDPSNNHWSLYLRDDGATAFADPSSGVSQQQGTTITDNTYTSVVSVNFGALFTWTAGTGKTMSLDNYNVVVTIPPCSTPGDPSGLSYANRSTGTSVSFTPPVTAPSGYILVQSAGPLSGAPAAGQAITPGTAVGSNGTIVGAGTSSPVATSVALTPNTNYTMTLFSYNNTRCTGGPVFNAPVSSNTITTCPFAPVLTGSDIPTSNAIPGITWSDPATGGGVYSSYTYLINVYTDAALTINAPGYPAAGTVVTSPYTISGLTPGVTYYYTITAVDASCNSDRSASNNATTSIVPCTGSPVSGTAFASPGSVTGSAPFSLGLIGSSGELGISFQWQSSSCNSAWTNTGGILAAPPLTTTESAGTFYRCMVTCANSGLSTYSTPVFVSNLATDYCYPAATNDCSSGDGINAFTLAGECGTSISDAGPLLCTTVNTDHTSYAPVSLFAGSSYAASVNSGNDGDDVYVWIDFDNNGLFDASELVYSTTTALVPSTPFFYNFTLPIPSVAAGATPGLHRMRVVVNNAQTLTTGCTTLTFGSSADYMVQILPNVAISHNSPVCDNGVLTLTATPAISCGATYSWSGPAGFNSTTVNTNTISAPVVSGTYSVSITVNGVSSCPVPATTTIVVNPAPVVTSSLTTMCVGSVTTVTGSPAGGAWASSNAGVASVGTTGIVTGVSLGNALVSYTLPVTGCAATSPIAITATPGAYAVSGGGLYCPGGTGAHVGLSSSDAGIVYQLYNSGIATGSLVTGTGYALDFGLTTATGTYTVTGNPGTSCATNMIGSTNVSLYGAMTTYSVTGGGNYCAGGAGMNIYLSGSTPGITYQLMNGLAPVGATIAGSGAVLDFGTISAAGTYTVVGTDTVTGCTAAMTGSATIAVNSLPVAFALTGGGSYCAGGSGVAVGLANSASGINYQLYANGAAFGSPVAGSGSAISFGAETATGIYTAIATDATSGCTSNMTGNATVTTGALAPLNTVTGGGAYCTGGSGVHIGIDGSATGYNYQLLNAGTPQGAAVAGTGSPLDFGAILPAGNFTVFALSASGSCVDTMIGSVTVNVNAAPSSLNVTGGGSYCSGGSGVSVGLDGSVIGTDYFLYDGSTLVGGASGTSAPLDFGLHTDAGTYTVAATIAATGCAGTMTGNAVVRINPLPAAFAISAGGSYCAGGTGVDIQLTNSAGGGVSYQLFKGITPENIPETGLLGPLDFGYVTDSGTYTVVATKTSTGCTNTMTGTAVVSISQLPSVYTATGGGSYCTGGAGVHIGVSNSDIGINYQLYYGMAPVGAVIAGTGAALDFGLQTAVGNYTVVAINPVTACTSNMSGTISVTTYPGVNAYNTVGGGNYCTGGTGSDIGLDNSDLGISYQLYNGATVAGPAVYGTGGGLDFGLQTAPGNYSVVATDPVAGCSNVMNGSAAVAIAPLPVAYPVTGGGGYCPSGTGAHIGLANSASGVNYQVYFGAAPVGGVVTGTGRALDLGTQSVAGTYTVIATDAVSACINNMSGSATVSVNPLPAVHTVTGGGSFYCAGGTGVHIGLNGSETGNTYQLFVGGSIVTAPVAGNGSAIDFGLQTTAGTYTVVATATGTGCNSNMSGGASVAVTGLAPMHLVTGGGNYCSGNPGVHVGLDGSDAGINYQLYHDLGAVGGAVAGTGGSLDLGIQSVNGTYTVVATNAATGCTNIMSGATSVGVAALPVVYNLTGGGSYCLGDAGVPVMLSNSTPGINYKLYNSGAATSADVTGTGTPLSFGTLTAGNYSVIATDGVTGCSNTMAGTAVVIANPLPAVSTVTGGGFYCAGGTGDHVGLNGSETGVTYQLYVNSIATPTVVSGNGAILDFGLQTVPGNYTVIATAASTGCSVTMASTASITTYPLPSAYNVTGGGSYCLSGHAPAIALDNSTSGVNYQLYNGTTAVAVPFSGTGGRLDFGPQGAAGNYTIFATDAATGCTNTMAGAATVSVLAAPAVYTVTGGGSYCSGGPGVHVQLNGSATGATYQLFNNNIAVAGMSPVSGTGAAIDFGIITDSGNYAVIATSGSTGCSALMTGSANVTFGALPTAYAVTGSSTTGYCAGGAGVNIYLRNSETGVRYQLYRGTNAVGAPVSGVASGLSFGAQVAEGNYTVTALNPATGCMNDMAGSITVSINPLPASYTVTGGGGYCAGGSAHIGLSNSATGIAYQLYHSGVVTGAAVMGTGTTLDLGAQTLTGGYTVIATNTATSCASNMTGSVTVSVNPAPVAYAVTGGGNFCTGGTGMHVGLSGSATGFSYQLHSGAVAIGTLVPGTGAALDFGSQSSSGLYTVVATGNATGCSALMTGGATVTALPLPAAHLVTGGGAYCAGDAGTHIGIDGSNTGISYKIYNGATLTGPAITGTGYTLDFGVFTLPGSYTVVAQDLTTACISNMTGTASVAVNPVPDVFSVAGGGNYCEGTAGSRVSLTGSATGVNYTLNIGTAAIGTFAGTGAPVSFGLQTATGVYTVTAADVTTGCVSHMGGSAVVGTTPVVVPSVTIATGGNDTVCSGVLTTFTASGINGGTAPVYQWTINGIPVSSAFAYSYLPVNGDVVGITYTSSAACATPATVTNSLPVSVLDMQIPGITISADPGTEVCQGTSVNFTATPSYGGSSPSFTWMNHGAIVTTGAVYNYVPANGDVITCKITSNYQCLLAASGVSAPANMVVDVPVIPVVSVAAYPGLKVAAGQPVTLDATVTNSVPAPTYQWQVNGITVAGITTPSFTSSEFNNGDIVNCLVTSGGGCANATGTGSVTLTVVGVGVNTLTKGADDISLLPNPNNGTFTIKGTVGMANEEVTMEVTNMLGQVIYTNKATATNGIINERIALGTIANGMYLMNVHTTGGSKVLHIVVAQ